MSTPDSSAVDLRFARRHPPTATPLHRDVRVTRVARGAYCPVEQWMNADDTGRYRALIYAAVRRRPGAVVVGYDSAAALWGYPRISPVPTEVHLVFPGAVRRHNRAGVRAHHGALAETDVRERDGILMTSPARTLVDLARTGAFDDSVAAMDFALNGRLCPPESSVTREQLRSVHLASTTSRGVARARVAIDFADGLSDSPGESLSRVRIAEAGLPAPRLQTRHSNPAGGWFYTDFEWREFGLIGEFDGRAKYVKERYLGGRSPGDVVYEEKRREDALRAEGFRVVRWGWRDLRAREALPRLLRAAGLSA